MKKVMRVKTNGKTAVKRGVAGAKTARKATAASNNADNAAMAMLERLYNEQVVWNNTLYKSANDRLLALLGECLDAYNMLSNDSNARKVLDAELEELKLVGNSRLHLSTRIVRYVFRLTNNRAAAYAQVLRAAAEAKVEPGKLRSWVAKAGGIEAVRRTKKDGKTAAAAMQDTVNAVTTALDSADALFSIAKAPLELKAGTEAFGNYCIALVRYNERTGQADIVWGTDNKALTKRCMATIGKAVLEQNKAADTAQTATKKRAASYAARTAGANNNKKHKAVA